MECPLREAKPPQFYIATKSSPVDERNRVLKYGKMFAVFDRFGDIETSGLGEGGIFFEGTRFLSELSLSIANSPPMLLSSTMRDDSVLFTADLTNIDIWRGTQVEIARGTLYVARCKTLWGATCYEELRISNYGLEPLSVPVGLQFSADFADLFEVRGTKRAAKGQFLPSIVNDDSVILSYHGLDGVCRYTCLRCTPAPHKITAGECQFELRLEPKQRVVLQLAISCQYDHSLSHTIPFRDALSASSAAMRAAGRGTECHIYSSNEQFNDWLRRSAADIQMMTVGNPEVNYPYAGVPWFSTVFGRDGIITALESLWMNPQIANGVLCHLAETQAMDFLPDSDAEPGKILHEARKGEMATLGEIPFRRYYGAVDTTPLFIVLAGAYYERTGDLALIQSIWPHIELALQWIERYGDRDGDGFVEYSHSKKGLVQQGWKDSHDSVFHANGSMAEAPIALCEVQGYVYAARRFAARLARALGNKEQAAALDIQADRLQANFEEQFWCKDIAMYALALDGAKKPCQVRTSNPGHCLATGIVSPDRAAMVAQALLSPDFFTGWGIRTVAASEVRYNPVSYHNGSVWPHDNALIAMGVSKYGLKHLAAQILTALLDVSVLVDLHRLPELLCGLERRSGEGPTLYPVACAPQAWSAGAVFMLLEACLGISIDAPNQRLTIDQPYLPNTLSQLTIRQLKIASASVDLLFEHTNHRVRVDLLNKQGDVEVTIHQPARHP
jgi:glycogen debranching enzyme